MPLKKIHPLSKLILTMISLCSLLALLILSSKKGALHEEQRFTVLRCRSFDSSGMLNAMQNLVQNTSYSKRPLAHREDAPFVTDCLTAIWYAYRGAGVEIPLTYLGDMPRTLCLEEYWSAITINRHELRCGDVIFLKKRSSKRLLSHVVLAVDTDHLFHCSRETGKGTIETIDELWDRYEQPLAKEQMISYVDPRNKAIPKELNSLATGRKTEPNALKSIYPYYTPYQQRYQELLP